MSEFNKKALIIVSSTAQIEMFKIITPKLNDFEIKFINYEKWAHVNEMEILLEKYLFNFDTVDNWNMRFCEKNSRKGGSKHNCHWS